MEDGVRQMSGVVLWRALSLLSAIGMLAACSVSAPIQPVGMSPSALEGAGQTISVLPTPTDNAAYRVFNQGGRAFVSMQSVRAQAEQRAHAFCGQKDKAMETLQETVAYAPYVFGHAPRVEIVFDCVEFGHIVDDTYEKLIDLKQRFDRGVFTKAQFEREKAKILAERR